VQKGTRLREGVVARVRQGRQARRWHVALVSARACAGVRAGVQVAVGGAGGSVEARSGQGGEVCLFPSAAQEKSLISHPILPKDVLYA